MKTGSSCIRKLFSVILMLLLTLSMGAAALDCICMNVSAVGFLGYIHDPALNPSAMNDITEDESAVYGFRPNETGSLKQYASKDWTDPVIVGQWRQERIEYHESLKSMYSMLDEMKARGCDAEEIARAVSARRNEIRIESYADDPEGLEEMKARNLEKYGREEGPTPDELYEKYGSWERVTEKAFSPNMGMDACLGLYDEYYDTYITLGIIDEFVPCDHSELESIPYNPASDGKPGNVEYYVCTNCGKWFWDAEGAREITDRNMLIIPAPEEEPTEDPEDGPEDEPTVDPAKETGTEPAGKPSGQPTVTDPVTDQKTEANEDIADAEMPENMYDGVDTGDDSTGNVAVICTVFTLISAAAVLICVKKKNNRTHFKDTK